MNYLRIAGAVAIVAALALLLWRVNAWHAGYVARDQAVAELAGYQTAVADRDKQASEEREAAGKRSELLAIKLGSVEAELEALRSKPIQSVVFHEKPAKDGKCDDPRIGPEWFGVFNETADIASRAVHAPN